MSKKIPLIKPYMTEAIKDSVGAVLDSGQFTEGLVTKQLEDIFCSYIGAKHAIATTSCTTGLELAIRALQLKPGDEVIVPDYTYPATAMAVCSAGAVPIIVDVDPKTQLISRSAVQAAISPLTRAIMPVSIFGTPLDYSWLNELKKQYGLYIIEDAACSIGTEWNGVKVGNFADISVFSLHPRKFITSGEGGIITTNDANFASWLRSYKRFGMSDSSKNREGIHFEITGINGKLSNVQAAIALGQLQDIEILMQKRQDQADYYKYLLQNVADITLPILPEQAKHSWQTFYISLARRDYILQAMRNQGIEVQIGTYSLHMHKAFQQKPYVLCTPFKGSKFCYENTLALPMFHDMTKEEQEYVVRVLLDTIRRSS